MLAWSIGFAYTGQDAPPGGASGGNRLPRDAAGHLDLNEGTGGVIAMCSCDGFLEVYKQDLTYRIQTPETIDPDRINPYTPFVAAVTDNVGSSNPIVARVLLQGLDILNGAVFARPIDEEAVTRELHAITEALVACHKVAERVVATLPASSTTGRSMGSQAMSVAPSIHSPRCPTSTQTPHPF